MTRTEIETALDAGLLFANLHGAVRPWKVRRNGRTKVWKTRPEDFAIPIKVGFKTCGHITDVNVNDPMWLIESNSY